MGNVSFVVTFGAWPTCGGPYNIQLEYTNDAMGVNLVSANGIAADPSGVAVVVVFPAVANANKPTGSVEFNTVINSSNNQSMDIGANPNPVRLHRIGATGHHDLCRRSECEHRGWSSATAWYLTSPATWCTRADVATATP
jgi:hypothetical protein